MKSIQNPAETNKLKSPKPKRPVGRPRNENRTEQQAKRRFYSFQKTDAFVGLVDQARAAYVIRHGHLPKTDTELFRDALGEYLKMK